MGDSLMAWIQGSLWEKIIPKIRVDEATGCWLWIGSVDRAGYGRLGQKKPVKSTLSAHRVVYELCRGPIPEGLVIDHLCRVPACVNPAHLEPVSQRENVSRGVLGGKTHCKRGHEFDGFNTYIAKNGTRHCKACSAMHARNYNQKLRSA